MTLFDTIGGQDAVDAAVDGLYERVLTDPQLIPIFRDYPTDRIKAHQRVFIATALGGPGRYTGRTMADAHADLRVTGAEFDRVVTHLVDTLAALGVTGDLRGQITGTVETLRSDIVTAGRGRKS